MFTGDQENHFPHWDVLFFFWIEIHCIFQAINFYLTKPEGTSNEDKHTYFEDLTEYHCRVLPLTMISTCKLFRVCEPLFYLHVEEKKILKSCCYPTDTVPNF